jgi:hypothetical protein
MANLRREDYIRSHLFTLDSLFQRSNFVYAELKGQAYAATYLGAARLAAQAGDRNDFFAYLRRAVKETPAALTRPEMAQALYQGLKLAFPPSFVDTARNWRLRMRARRQTQRAG